MIAPATSPCPDCAAPVLATPRLLLDARPDVLGIFRVDGRPMRQRDYEQFFSPSRPAGRRAHVCRRPGVALHAEDTGAAA